MHHGSLLYLIDVVRTCTDVAQVVMDNGMVKVMISKPDGFVTGIKYNGISNLLEVRNEEFDRGYIDN